MVQLWPFLEPFSSNNRPIGLRKWLSLTLPVAASVRSAHHLNAKPPDYDKMVRLAVVLPFHRTISTLSLRATGLG